MRRLNRLSIFVWLWLAGCASQPPVFVAASALAENASVVYIYRPAKAANVMLSPAVSIAGVKTFRISSGEYKQLELPPGRHVISLAATEGNTPAVVHDLEVVAQQVSFLRVEALMKMQVGQSYQPYQRRFELQAVAAEKALTEIAACADMDGREPQRKSAVTAADDAGNDGGEDNEAVFSVDKTANPFSR